MRFSFVGVVLASLPLIFAAEAAAAPIEVTYHLQGGNFGLFGNPLGYDEGDGDLVVTWAGTPGGAITAANGLVKSFAFSQVVDRTFGIGSFRFHGLVRFSGLPGIPATINPIGPKLTIAGPGRVFGSISCLNGFEPTACSVFGLNSGPNPFSQTLTFAFNMNLDHTDPLEPNHFSLSATPLGVRIANFSDLSLSFDGYEVFREVVPEPASGSLVALGLLLMTGAAAGWRRLRH
jgi:hypothetical protein